MKTHVITLAKTFQSKHPRKGELTGFKQAFILGQKKHTIRGNYDYWAPRIQEVIDGKAILSVREWIDKPYKQPGQQTITNLDASSGLGYEPFAMSDDTHTKIRIGDGLYYDADQLDEIAKNDGLTFTNFYYWFFPDGKKRFYRNAILIHFTDFRY